MKKSILICLFITGACLFLLLGCSKDNDDASDSQIQDCGTVTDIDGNIYKTVKIGNKCWMAENLRVTRFRNGQAISNITNSVEWGNADIPETPAYCVYDNNTANGETYGYLYNWYAVNDSRGLAPQGWHIATDAEWEEMIDHLGGSGVAAGKMKEVGTLHWSDPNTGADNKSGFTALPSGFRGNGEFSGLGERCNFWTATQWDSETAFSRTLQYMSAGTGKGPHGFVLGESVRCVKD